MTVTDKHASTGSVVNAVKNQTINRTHFLDKWSETIDELQTDIDAYRREEQYNIQIIFDRKSRDKPFSRS